MYVISLLSILITYLSIPGNWIESQKADSRLITADSLYSMHRYNDALPLYEQLVDEAYDSDIQFKIAVCNYHHMRYYYSMKIFHSLHDNNFPLLEYVDYFLCLISLKLEQKETLVDRTNHFLQRYNTHFLCDSLRLHLADYMYREGEYSKAKSEWLKQEKISETVH